MRGIKLRETRHCGKCFPCIMRRAAIHYADLWDYDASYAEDITTAYSQISNQGRELIFEMMDFGREIEKFSSVDEALNEFPQFYPGEMISPSEFFEMVKRHVTQFKDFVSRRCHESLRDRLQFP